MADWTLLQWLGAIAAVFTVIGVIYGFTSGRKGKPTTKNVAQNSRDVTQTGGDGVTDNEAKDSTNVNQSGS